MDNTSISPVENCSEAYEWLATSVGLNTFAVLSKCVIIIAGVTLNSMVIWVLLHHPRSPFDVIQLHQSIGSWLDAVLSLPLFFGAFICYKWNLNLAFRLYAGSMYMFIVNWSFQNLCAILMVMVRALQICKLSRRNILNHNLVIKYMVGFWALSITWPAIDSIRINLEFSDGNVRTEFPSSDAIRSIFIVSLLATLLIIAVASVCVYHFLSRNFRWGFGTLHLKHAMNTITIGFAASCIAQVRDVIHRVGLSVSLRYPLL